MPTISWSRNKDKAGTAAQGTKRGNSTNHNARPNKSSRQRSNEEMDNAFKASKKGEKDFLLGAENYLPFCIMLKGRLEATNKYGLMPQLINTNKPYMPDKPKKPPAKCSKWVYDNRLHMKKAWLNETEKIKSLGPQFYNDIHECITNKALIQIMVHTNYSKNHETTRDPYDLWKIINETFIGKRADMSEAEAMDAKSAAQLTWANICQDRKSLIDWKVAITNAATNVFVYDASVTVAEIVHRFITRLNALQYGPFMVQYANETRHDNTKLIKDLDVAYNRVATHLVSPPTTMHNISSNQAAFAVSSKPSKPNPNQGNKAKKVQEKPSNKRKRADDEKVVAVTTGGTGGNVPTCMACKQVKLDANHFFNECPIIAAGVKDFEARNKSSNGKVMYTVLASLSTPMRNAVVFDTAATESIFCNSKLLSNTSRLNNGLSFTGLSGAALNVTECGTSTNFGVIAFHSKALTNILSATRVHALGHHIYFCNDNNRYEVTCMTVVNGVKVAGDVYLFEDHGDGLYSFYANYPADTNENILVSSINIHTSSDDMSDIISDEFCSVTEHKSELGPDSAPSTTTQRTKCHKPNPDSSGDTNMSLSSVSFPQNPDPSPSGAIPTWLKVGSGSGGGRSRIRS